MHLLLMSTPAANVCTPFALHEQTSRIKRSCVFACKHPHTRAPKHAKHICRQMLLSTTNHLHAHACTHTDPRARTHTHIHTCTHTHAGSFLWPSTAPCTSGRSLLQPAPPPPPARHPPCRQACVHLLTWQCGSRPHHIGAWRMRQGGMARALPVPERHLPCPARHLPWKQASTDIYQQASRLTLLRRISSPVFRRMALPVSRRMALPVLRRMALPMFRRMALPVLRRMALPLSRHMALTLLRRMALPLLRHMALVP